MSDEPMEIDITNKIKHITIEIDNRLFHTKLFPPTVKMMMNANEENADCRKIICNWIFNGISEDEKQFISIDKIYVQDDSFFEKILIKFIEDENEWFSHYNKLDSSKEICYRFLTSYENYTCEKLSNAINSFSSTFTNMISSTLARANETMSKFASTAKPIFENINNFISSFYESISTIKFPTISEERKQNLLDSYEKWGEYGWTEHPESPLFYFEFCPNSQIEADKYALKLCNKSNMLILFDEIKKFNVSIKDVNEAINCYNNRCYKACSLLLFSLIEKELIKIQIKDKKDHKDVGQNAVKYLNKKVKNNLDMEENFLILLHYRCLYTCLFKYFQNGENFKLQTNVINRNLLGHNMEKKQIRKKDCIKLFLLLYNILFFIDLYNRELWI